jgi:hypothetical protein
MRVAESAASVTGEIGLGVHGRADATVARPARFRVEPAAGPARMSFETRGSNIEISW